jgi:hypothetical protein
MNKASRIYGAISGMFASAREFRPLPSLLARFAAAVNGGKGTRRIVSEMNFPPAEDASGRRGSFNAHEEYSIEHGVSRKEKIFPIHLSGRSGWRKILR